MKSIWTATYEGNDIKVENTWFNGERLYVNGNLQDEKFGLFSSDLTGHIVNHKNEREYIKVNIGGIFKIECKLFIDDSKIAVKLEK